jgi:hypothetical protein
MILPATLNLCLGEFGETPVVKKQVHYPKDKLKRKVMIQDAESSDSGDDGEIIKQKGFTLLLKEVRRYES